MERIGDLNMLLPDEHKFIVRYYNRTLYAAEGANKAVNLTYLRQMVQYNNRFNISYRMIVEKLVEDKLLKKFKLGSNVLYYVREDQKVNAIKAYSEYCSDLRKKHVATHLYTYTRNNNRRWKKLSKEELYEKKARLMVKIEYINEILDEK